MRIAIFTELYAPSIGGQEVFFAGLGRAMFNRGHEIDVYCIGHERDLAESEVLAGLAIHRYPNVPSYKTPHTAVMRRNWSAIVRYAFHVRAVAKRGHHDAYLLNEWPLLHVLTIPPKARCKALLHWCEVRRSPFYRAVQKWLPGRVRLNAAISDSVAEQIQATSTVPVMTLPSGLDLSRSRFVERAQRRDILVLGRIATHKNLPMMVAAFEILKASGYAGRLKIAGDGPAMPELRARVDASPVRDVIDLLGFISDDQKFELIANAEVLAMPSKREGFPHVTSEAMSCGLPIVTMDYPENGTKDVVLSFGSGVVTGQSAQAFADGIAQALLRWDEFSRKGLEGARTLDWDSIAERLERQLQALGEVGQKGLPGLMRSRSWIQGARARCPSVKG